MSARLTCFALALSLILEGCAAPSFYPHESRNNVYQGKGGSRFTVHGVDVWFNGEPNHTYSIIGYIEDNRALGIDTDHKSIPEDIYKKAVEVGADGLIQTVVTSRGGNSAASGMVFHGGPRTGVGFGFGYGAPIDYDRVTVKYTAVKYLD